MLNQIAATQVGPILTAALLAVMAAGCHVFENTSDHPFPESDQTAGDADLDPGDLVTEVSDLDDTDPDLPPDLDTSDGTDMADSGMCSSDADCTCGQVCTDGRCQGCSDCDGDGYGEGCARGADCDDNDPSIIPFTLSSCTVDGEQGVCRQGSRLCRASGDFTDCSPGRPAPFEICDDADNDCDGVPDNDVLPPTCLGECAVNTGCSEGAAAECPVGSAFDSCNGADDNCDGVVDTECTDDCYYVAPSAVGIADGELASPASLTSGVLSVPGRRVCLLAEAGCDPQEYVLPVSASMAANVEVIGSYDPITGQRCAGRAATLRLAGNPSLVIDEPGVAIAGVQLSRPTLSNGANVYNAIDINGGQLTLSNVGFVGSIGSANASRAVNVRNGGELVFARSLVTDSGSTYETGIRAISGSTVTVVDNCTQDVNNLDDGKCTASCDNLGNLAVGFHLGTNKSAATGVLLQGGSDSRIERNLFCLSAQTAADAIVINGTESCPSEGCDNPVIRGNSIEVGGATSAIGLEVRELDGQARVVDNTININGQTTSGIKVIGTRAQVSGNTITGEGESKQEATGIECRAGNSTLADCMVFGNAVNPGSAAISSTGIACIASGKSDTPCRLLVANSVYGGTSAQPTAIKLNLGRSLVGNNVAVGGCAVSGLPAVGIDLIQANAVLQNNFAVGSACQGSGIGVALDYSTDADIPAILDSNSITGAGLEGDSCNESIGLFVTGSEARGDGLLINNIIHSGACADSVAIERFGQVTPILVANAVLDDNGGYYRTDETVISDLTELPGTQSESFTCEPLWPEPHVGELHLGQGSTCIGAALNAPEIDIDFALRNDGNPDAGADEYGAE